MEVIICRCGKDFTTYPSRRKTGRGKYCSRSCKDSARRDAAARSQRYVTSTQPHALLPDGKRVGVHRIVLYDKIGPGKHSCYWCGAVVEWRRNARTEAGALVVDHLDNNPKNNAKDNLVPSCHRCNCIRGMTNRIADGEPYVLMKDRFGKYRKHRAVVVVCATCGGQFNKLAADKRPGRGKYCSRKCLYAKRRP